MTPTPRLITIDAWSYSRFQTYQGCPQKAKYQYIDKLKEPDHPASANGTRVHAIADVVVSGRITLERDQEHLRPELERILKSKKIPQELDSFKAEFQFMQKVGAVVQSQWTFDRDWNYLPPPNGWFSKQAWLRVKVDAYYLTEKKLKGGRRETTVHIVDHKTGKWNAAHEEQRSLYALGAMLLFPDAAVVTAAHWYLDLGKEDRQTWLRGQVDALKAEWTRKTTAMLNDTTFTPNPTAACRWCHFRKENNGPCSF